MGTPGFTAETALYRTGANYFGWHSGTTHSGGGFKFDLFSPIARLTPFLLCGALGQPCCRDPYQNPSDGPLVACDNGLGCDITTNRCVATCGMPGQPCCDGPETRAPKWTSTGAVYSPDYFGMKEMCQLGACDTQSHRCFSCGTQDGNPCCPPDAAQATARCTGASLHCEYDPGTFYTSGTCRACGKVDRPPCATGCDPGLGIRGGLCEFCGGDNQLPCDSGCNFPLGLIGGICRLCGDIGQIPCDNGCKNTLGIKGGLCAVCGSPNQPTCDSGCRTGAVASNGRCVECGHTNELPCSNGCVYPLKTANGICRSCGASGQVPCDSGCNSGLVVNNGLCGPNQPGQPSNCASVGEACEPDNQPGTHCCQNPNAPELCVYNICKACIPHGGLVPNFGTQICCDAKDGDQPVLDQATGTVICGIPG